jgi:ribosomal protein S27E
MDGHLDGNALAGVLSEFFVFDVTTARSRCASCGDIAVIARALVFGSEQARVIRCSHCGDVLMVVLQEPDGVRVHMRGMSWMDVAG